VTTTGWVPSWHADVKLSPSAGQPATLDPAHGQHGHWVHEADQPVQPCRAYQVLSLVIKQEDAFDPLLVLAF
jgi:hypothetical protein